MTLVNIRVDDKSKLNMKWKQCVFIYAHEKFGYSKGDPVEKKIIINCFGVMLTCVFS